MQRYNFFGKRSIYISFIFLFPCRILPIGVWKNDTVATKLLKYGFRTQKKSSDKKIYPVLAVYEEE